MKITIINGSPRKNGNCSVLLEEVKRAAEDNNTDVVHYNINELNIGPCKGCDYCVSRGHCKFDDDAIEILENLETSDLLVFASPIYYGQVTAQSKLIIDRFYSISMNYSRNFPPKAIAIFTHALEEGAFENYIGMVKKMPFEYIGCDTKILTVGSVSAQGDVKNQRDKLKEAYDLTEEALQ